MNSSFEQTIERLAIDAEIRDLAARFSDAVNRRDPDAFGDLLADDGVWEIGEPSRAGIYWNNHHHMLAAVTRISGMTLWANQHLLFWLSLIPVATAWMSENHFPPIPVAAYGLVLLAASLAYYTLQATLLHTEGDSSLLAAPCWPPRSAPTSRARPPSRCTAWASACPSPTGGSASPSTSPSHSCGSYRTGASNARSPERIRTLAASHLDDAPAWGPGLGPAADLAIAVVILAAS